MRLISTFQDIEKGKLISAYLTSQGIENQYEIVHITDWGSPDYGNHISNIWITNEDDLKGAVDILEKFKENPDDPMFLKIKKETNPIISLFSDSKEAEAIAETESKMAILDSSNESPNEFSPEKKQENQNLGFMTFYIFLLCCLIFISNELSIPESVRQNSNILSVYTTPVYRMLFYDLPKSSEIIDDLVDNYGIEKLSDNTPLPKEAQALVYEYNHSTFWKGFYNNVMRYIEKGTDPWKIDAPLFTKIKEGEIWRIFTPIFMHGSFFHILFNMMGLLVLGKQMEQRIGGVRYVLFILIAAAFSNTTQYLMSGPFFLGFSGVLCAMLTYIWTRQRIAAWEGYQLQSTSFAFVIFFIFTMLGLQIISFLISIYMKQNLSLPIANTAHFTGAIIGLILGRMNYFAQRDS